MKLLHIQGMIFCGIAAFVALVSHFFTSFAAEDTLLVLALLILVLGVPHGALDPVFAHRLYRIGTPLGWLSFVAIYLLLALLVVLLWRVAPLLFLCGFLLISLLHFSGDPQTGTAWSARLLYGGAPIILPTLLHAVETTRLFSFLIDPASAHALVSGLSLLALPWLVALLVACLYRLHSNAITALEMLSVALLAVVATPLVSFTVFFCCMHSPRHLLRTWQHTRVHSLKRLLAIASGPLLGVGVLLLGSSALLAQTAWDAKLIQIIFVGLAALTVPHMVLVEQIRFYGWPEENFHG